MNKFLLLSTLLIGITSCSISKKPEFKYVDNIEVKNVSMRNITLKADAVFNNPNHIKGKLSIDSIHIFVDNMDVGALSSQEFDVPSKNEFAIPLEGTFSLSKVYKKNKNSILGSVLKVIQSDSLDIQYKGVIRYYFGNFSYPYTIDKQQKVRLK
ncbi:hypothetical protein IWQ47_003968 [Aquimarina sp. EL_43]|uniref:hypothetical protein n=1 Tax=Aquimarina TaxID=290174 RepID=UPI000472B7A1|nr:MULTISPECIES: hypothetical protein [Aquimarina]MBG6132077.1 hypothetical protein [Aquimarina sp. EL_35]MBG6152874.1 hypothetical protein [Aquimarina sp. EL_32]MBG6170881.1 hypothetical protein [Aquimarina sp. EL_43]